MSHDHLTCRCGRLARADLLTESWCRLLAAELSSRIDHRGIPSLFLSLQKKLSKELIPECAFNATISSRLTGSPLSVVCRVINEILLPKLLLQPETPLFDLFRVLLYSYFVLHNL